MKQRKVQLADAPEVERRFNVLFTRDADIDLNELIDFIAAQDGEGQADQILEKFERAVSSLAETPDRGVWPKELSDIGIRDFREVFFKPYRIIYRVDGANVHIMLITDGRRDMQTLLQRRLLRSI
jgi:toxin ParE1/3/4